jgi:putative membrane protein
VPDLYLWLKALHIMAWTSWMAGLFYLPRLMVYHAERAAPGSEASETFKVMERKLLRLIMRPAMLGAWATGLALIWLGVDFSTAYWLHAKLALVVPLTATHMAMARWVRAFSEDRNQRSGRFFRIWNEAPTLLFAGIVILAIVRPF